MILANNGNEIDKLLVFAWGFILLSITPRGFVFYAVIVIKIIGVFDKRQVKHLDIYVIISCLEDSCNVRMTDDQYIRVGTKHS